MAAEERFGQEVPGRKIHCAELAGKMNAGVRCADRSKCRGKGYRTAQCMEVRAGRHPETNTSPFGVAEVKSKSIRLGGRRNHQKRQSKCQCQKGDLSEGH